MSRRGVIYRLYDGDGQLLYIGRTVRHPSQRMREHGDVQSWWDQVATGTMEFVPLGEVDAVERRAILAENPLHNLERHPVKQPRRVVQRTWAPMPDGLSNRLYRAGRKYSRSHTRANRTALAAIAYEAFMFGCSPAGVAITAGLGREEARRLAEEHRGRNPELPPTPRRHGQGKYEYPARSWDSEVG